MKLVRLGEIISAFLLKIRQESQKKEKRMEKITSLFLPRIC